MSKKLFESALEVRNHSHSPYSSYKVAAAVLTEDGSVFSGVNVENASYGATICAERSAICSAISAGKKKVTEVLVLTDESTPWPPCGMCRQVIAEFAQPQTKIHLANLKGIQQSLLFSDLFPQAFVPEHLK